MAAKNGVGHSMNGKCPQSRITDHRIGFTTHRLADVLEGNLDELIGPLSSQFQAERLRDEMARA